MAATNYANRVRRLSRTLTFTGGTTNCGNCADCRPSIWFTCVWVAHTQLPVAGEMASVACEGLVLVPWSAPNVTFASDKTTKRRNWYVACNWQAWCPKITSQRNHRTQTSRLSFMSFSSKATKNNSDGHFVCLTGASFAAWRHVFLCLFEEPGTSVSVRVNFGLATWGCDVLVTDRNPATF